MHLTYRLRNRLVTDLIRPPSPMKVSALLVGFLAVVALSLGTDQLFHVLGVYPPWGEPMRDAGDNILALTYRCIYAVLGSWIAARLASEAPMRHAIALGVIGFALA